MRKAFFIALLCAVFMAGYNCFSQQVYVKSNVSTDSIIIGQHFDYQLSLYIPKDYYVEWTRFGDTLSKSVEIIKASEVETTPVNDDNVMMTQHLTLTSFDTGYVYVPEIGITYAESIKDSLRHTLYTDEAELYVSTVAVDTTQAIRPLKSVIRQGYTSKEILPVVGIILLLAGITYLIYRSSKKKKASVVKEEKQKPAIPAIVTAREKLLEIKTSEAWKTSNNKEYYTSITDIVRVYLDGQFDIEAVEMTSDEILDAVKALNISSITTDRLRNTLTMSDLVKFAKASPNASQNEQAYNDINSFVEDTFSFFVEEEKRKAEEMKNRKKSEKAESNNKETEETK